MSAKVRGRLGREASAIAYKQALIALSNGHPRHISGIREYVRNLRDECAHRRAWLRAEQQRNQELSSEVQILRAEVEELRREGVHCG